MPSYDFVGRVYDSVSSTFDVVKKRRIKERKDTLQESSCSLRVVGRVNDSVLSTFVVAQKRIILQCQLTTSQGEFLCLPAMLLGLFFKYDPCIVSP
jgi:uncharacterized protein YdaL